MVKFVCWFVLMLTRNKGTELENVCRGNQKVVSGEFAELESPVITIKYFAIACQLCLSS